MESKVQEGTTEMSSWRGGTILEVDDGVGSSFGTSERTVQSISEVEREGRSGQLSGGAERRGTRYQDILALGTSVRYS